MKQISLLAFLFSLTACGTIAHGTAQRVPVITSPSGATVTADCGRGARFVGETPVVVKVSRKADRCIINVQKNGYEDRSVVLTRHLSGWVWGNVLFDSAAIPFALIDLFDGGAYYRAPASVKMRLFELRDGRESWRERPSR